MYDNVVNSYIKGEIDRATCRQMMWIMGASQTEMYFYLQEADGQRANNASVCTCETPVFSDERQRICGRCGLKFAEGDKNFIDRMAKDILTHARPK